MYSTAPALSNRKPADAAR